MASASLDSKVLLSFDLCSFQVILYDTVDLQKVCEFKEAHRRGVYAVAFDD